MHRNVLSNKHAGKRATATTTTAISADNLAETVYGATRTYPHYHRRNTQVRILLSWIGAPVKLKANETYLRVVGTVQYHVGCVQGGCAFHNILK